MIFASLLSCLFPLKCKDDESKDFANLLDDCIFSAENSVWHVIGMESFLLLFLKKEDIIVQSFIHVPLFVTGGETMETVIDCSTPGFPVFHHLPELAQTHVHCVGDAV